MKCPRCGFKNNRNATRCTKCGAAFAIEAQPDLGQEPVHVQQPNPVPEWRKEVTRKAREYGERKKVLTTPPHPIKAQATETIAEAEPLRVEEPDDEKFEIENVVEPKEITPPQRIIPPQPPPVKQPANPNPINLEPKLHARLEFDLQAIPILEPEPEVDDVEQMPLHLGRRAASLLVDHAILGVLAYVVIFVCREVFSYNLKTLFQSAPFPIVGGVLLFHFLYYFYFHKTSRQTPGQVFFSLELRDPLSGGIATGKVFIRWAALVFLNVLNLLPVLLGKNFVLLDKLSDTEIRSFKESA